MAKKILLGVMVLVVMGAGVVTYRSVFSKAPAANYLFADITRGDLETTISSSGTLSPVTTVEVGTQVSGIIDKVLVDFNSRVEKGQLLAMLDTELLQVTVLDAQAGLDRAGAQLEEAQAEQQRNFALFNDDLISEAQYLPYKIGLKIAQATYKSAEATIKRAERNLKYAYIRSPINGTVIERNVEEGQTVAASFSTPTLFKIAEDLSKMEILAEVDESDIGLIAKGQPARFEVQAYSDKIFTGDVRQVRLQPAVISNVVTYTVVVDAANKENLLLPGMTATVDFIIEQKKDVLLIPNAALRFQPADAEVEAFREERRTAQQALPDSLRERRGRRMNGGGGRGEGRPSGRQMPADMKQVWYLDAQGALAMTMARVGASNGSQTEIIRSRNLEAGMQVITGSSSGTVRQSGSRNEQNRFSGPPRRGF